MYKISNWLNALQSTLICCKHKLIAKGGFVKKRNGTYWHYTNMQNYAKFSSSKTSLSASRDDKYPSLPLQPSDTLIETWFYTVAPRGSLQLNLPFNTVVRPLNPQSCPDMDKAIIEIHFDKSCGAKIPPSHHLSQFRDLFKLDVEFDQDAAKLNVAATVTSGIILPVICMMWIPLQSGLC